MENNRPAISVLAFQNTNTLISGHNSVSWLFILPEGKKKRAPIELTLLHKFYFIFIFQNSNTYVHVSICGKWEITKLKQNTVNINDICLWPIHPELALSSIYFVLQNLLHFTTYMFSRKKWFFKKRNQFIPDMAGKQLEVVNTLQQWSTSAHLASNI